MDLDPGPGPRTRTPDPDPGPGPELDPRTHGPTDPRTPDPGRYNPRTMNPIVRGGLLIGGLCAAWMFVMGLTGWYKDPATANRFYFVVVIEVAGLIWTLRKTALEGRTYSGQVVAGTLAAMTAAVVLFFSSLAFTLLAYPTFFQDVEPMRREMLRSLGVSASEIDAAIRGMTPTAEAFQGALYTVLTGIIASAIIAIWVRAKGPAVPAARV